MIRLDKYQAATKHLRSLFWVFVPVYLLLSIPWPFGSNNEGHGHLFSLSVISCVVVLGIGLRVRRGGASSSSCPTVHKSRVKPEAPVQKNLLSERSLQLPEKIGLHSTVKTSATSNEKQRELKRNTPSSSTDPKTKTQSSISLPSKDCIDILTSALLLPDNVFNTICVYLNPRDLTACLAPASKMARVRADANVIWLEYWHRDYGNALLEWDVGKEVLSGSLGLAKQDITSSSSKVELKRALTQKLSTLKSTKDFFFEFGECWMNFLLAGYNDPKSKCLVGLHGHVFDFGAFAPFHPGLVDTILQDCGQDATEAFETIRHSRPARVLASMTCLLVSSRRDDGSQYLTSGKSINEAERDAVFRLSSTRPPRSGRDEAERLLPRVPKRRTPATLARVRVKFDRERSEHECSNWSVYYDPIMQLWMRWSSTSTIGVGSSSQSLRVGHLRFHPSQTAITE